MKSIALITYSGSHELADDSLLVGLLKKRGFTAQMISWDAKTEWKQFDGIILRSCWDYHTRVDEFLDWCAMLKREQLNIWNPVDAILWNYEKTYLRNLANKGIKTIQTQWFQINSECRLQDVLLVKGFEYVVVKPTIGASAYEVFLADKNNCSKMQPRVDALLQKSGVMIQRFMKEIQNTGEVSLIFIGRKYSHGALKMPKPNDFRSNYDGTVKIFYPSENIIKQAEKIIETIEFQILYARVDGIIINDSLTLMELELIEPYLFFDIYPKGAERFAEALEEIV